MLSKLWAPANKRQRISRGGWRQAGDAVAPSSVSDAEISHLAGGQLSTWCDGFLSASGVQMANADAIRDGMKHPMVQRFADLGQGQHAQRGIMQRLDLCGIFCFIDEVPDPCEVTHSVLPSKWIALLSQYPDEFRLRCGADAIKLRLFWAGFLSNPVTAAIARKHPVLQGKPLDELQFVIPWTCHSDAGPCSKTGSVNIVSVPPLLANGPELLTKYPCASYLKNEEYDRNIWTKVLADFDKLGGGVECGGVCWQHALLFSKADEQAKCADYGATHYNAESEICPDCRCNRDTLPFTDNRPHATWRASESMTFESCKARFRQPAHPLVMSRYFCHRWFFVLDIMHLLDCKGVTAIVIGGCLYISLREPALGHNLQARMDTINTLRKTHYENRGGVSRLPKLLLSNCTSSDGWAVLSGKAIKAAMTRQSLPFWSELVHRYCISDAPKHRNLRSLVDSLSEIYRVFYTGPMFLNSDDQGKLRVACSTFGVCYQRLRELHRQEQSLAFNVVPKIHKLQHLPMHATCINPKFLQCYGEESLIGTSTRTYSGSMNGRYQGSIQRLFLVKRVTALLLRFELPKKG